MELGKLFLSSVLVIVYYFLFGRESIDKLLQEEMTISHSDEEPNKIEAPGNVRELKSKSELSPETLILGSQN